VTQRKNIDTRLSFVMTAASLASVTFLLVYSHASLVYNSEWEPMWDVVELP